MINKKIISLIIALGLTACSSSKNNTDVKSQGLIKSDTMFSVPASLLAEAEKPQVVYFDTDSSELRSDSVSTLKRKVLPAAKDLNTKKVVIEAHADERGTNAYNKKLSERRANAVKDYLVKNGVIVKIKTVGYGESKPVATGHDENSWSQNRRAVTISVKR